MNLYPKYEAIPIEIQMGQGCKKAKFILFKKKDKKNS
jgi:hypothetical protein